MKKKKKKMKKCFIKFCLIILILFGIGNLVYYGIGPNIKNIYVLDNNYLSDQEIIDLAGLNTYPNFYTTSSSSIKKKLKSNTLIKDIKIKKRLFNKIYIYVDEYEVLFYNQNTSKYVLENKKEVLLDGIVVPTLINYVPDTKYNTFINKYILLDDKVKQKISEIKYDPNTIDEDRFFLYMNDGNYVYITLTKMELLNKYNEAITKVEGKKGTLYLDSGNYFEIR